MAERIICAKCLLFINVIYETAKQKNLFFFKKGIDKQKNCVIISLQKRPKPSKKGVARRGSEVQVRRNGRDKDAFGTIFSGKTAQGFLLKEGKLAGKERSESEEGSEGNTDRDGKEPPCTCRHDRSADAEAP